MKKVTLQTIADQLQVSKALVSKALSNDPAVNEETKEIIWKTANELGYRVKNSKKAVPASRTGNVAVLMPRAYLDDFEYWGKVVLGIDKALSQQNFSMMLSGIDIELSPKEGMPASIYENKVDGAIVLGHLPESYIHLLKVRNFPFVMVDSNLQDSQIDHVLSNNFLGAYEATSYLLQNGFDKLAFVGDAESAWSFSERLRGFNQSILDYNIRHGASAEYQYIRGMGVSAQGNYVQPEFKKNLKQRLTEPEPYAALFCANDMIAIEVMKIAAEWGLQCPRDYSIIGFDDLSICEFMQPQITTVSVPKIEMGMRAVQLMLRKINEPKALPELVHLSTYLVKRASVKTLG